MNLRHLFLLLENETTTIHQRSGECGLDPVVTLGVAKLLLANDGNLASLSIRQRQCYDQVLLPLIEAKG